MARNGFVGAAVLSIVLGTGALAQSSGVPAEFPPADFDGNQFVDSEGCAFVRAGMSGNVSWVPRVDRTRRQLCNFQPTFAAAPPAAPEPVTAPEAEAVMAEAAPEPAPEVETEAPMETVASLAAPVAPAPAPVVAAAPVTPRIVRQPTPRVVPILAPTPEPAPVAAPPQMTRAEACAGKFGVQAGYISARTGEAIDCGPEPQPVVVAAPVVPQAPQPRQLTLAQACAEMAENNKTLMNAATGEPVACPAAPVVIAAAPVASETCVAVPHMNTPAGMPVRCGPQAARPYTLANGTTAMAVSTSSVPASNPRVATATPATPPAGYVTAWNDGRLNPNRGLPRASAETQVVPSAARVSTRTTAPADVRTPAEATAHRYVQVGSFGEPGNVTRLVARLSGMGMPVATAQSGALQIVAAGPFGNAADLQRALQAVRGLGFGDAFTRK